jgi:hypothetical protein
MRRRQLIARGAVDCLFKPSSQQGLKAALEAALQEAERGNRHERSDSPRPDQEVLLYAGGRTDPKAPLYSLLTMTSPCVNRWEHSLRNPVNDGEEHESAHHSLSCSSGSRSGQT